MVPPDKVLLDWNFLSIFCLIFTVARSIVAGHMLQPALRKSGLALTDSSHLAALGWKALSRGVLMLYGLVRDLQT